METFRFPETRLVRVGSKITQVATFISNENGRDTGPQLSDSSQELLQRILRATILSPPAETTIELDHDEFCLKITKKPWSFPLKWDILIDDKEVEPLDFKFLFHLSGPRTVQEGEE
ncbi:hypothetical protein BGX34_003934 [Mortierella sp. NVP85]|nr:hypothetical protein BGX34_003934 [Mortierella sp. NVP85]